MKMRAIGETGGTGIPEQVTGLHILPNFYLDLHQVPIDGLKTEIVNQLDHSAQAAGLVIAGPLHDSLGRGKDGCALHSLEVDAFVECITIQNRVFPLAIS